MALTLIDKHFGLYKFKQYLEFRLRGKLDYSHIDIETNKIRFSSTIHYYNLGNNNSIFYFINDDIFYFGLDDDIYQYINNIAILSISGNFKFRIKLKDAFYFARDTGDDENIFLLVPINYENLSDIETSVFLQKNKIEIIDNKKYINFGGIKDNISILRNLRNFMSRTTIDMSITSFLKVNSTYVPKRFHDGKFCRKCHNLISKSYKNKEFFKEFVPNNRGFCVDCYSKMLMGYFVSKFIFPIFHKQEVLMKLANDDQVFGFYFKLFEYYGEFKNGILDFNELKKYYSNQSVPRRLNLDTPYYKHIRTKLLSINTIIKFGNSKEVSDFERVLFENNLSYADALDIKNKLEYDAIFESSVSHYYSHDLDIDGEVHKEIMHLIKEKNASNVDTYYCFDCIVELNKLTLNSNGDLNKDFINRITSHGLNKNVCFNIRNSLINDINNGLITKNDIKNKFNSLIAKLIQEHRKNLIKEKNYYSIDDKIHIKGVIDIVDQNKIFELIKFIQSLGFNIKLDNFILFNLNDEFLKFMIDFKIDTNEIKSMDKLLKNRGFTKSIFDSSSGDSID